MPPKFDLQDSRAMIATYAPGFARPPEIERLAAALEEIELLQDDVDGLTTALASSGKTIVIGSEAQAKRIAELESEAQEYHDRREEYAGIISELKDALVEKRAKCIMLIEKLQDVANNIDWKKRGLSKKLDAYVQEARQQLRQEGLL